MTKRMLIDATNAEETRVVVLDGNRLEDFDVETSTKRQLKGNIYLAKVVRVEPSLQAAFVEYGGGRHGFLAFGEIHPDYYQIPVADRQHLLEMQAEEARRDEEEEDRAAAAEEAGETVSANVREIEISRAEPETIERGEAGVHERSEPGVHERSEPGVHERSEPGVHERSEPGMAEHDQSGNATHDGGGDADTHSVAGHSHERAADSVEAGADPRTEAGPEVPAPPGWADAPAPAQPEPRVQAAAIDHETLFERHETLSETHETLSETIDKLAPADPGPQPEFAFAAPAEQPNQDASDTGAIQDPHDEHDDAADAAEDPRTQRIPPRFLRNYKIQEVIKRRQILLIQVVKEERGTKGAALTTYISLAGRFCVLMPNSPRGGGISRKITSAADRRRLKEITAELAIPKGMGLIVRTAGAQRPKPEIKRDCEYLMRLWDDIREHTMRSVAPALIYEEASLIKRAIRDVYSRDVDDILVDGEAAWHAAHDFMRMLMPTHAKKVQLWRDPNGQPLFARHQVDAQLDAMMSPTVQLKSGGYLVINQAEALVAVDVNSGRSTRERGIEETALRTNLEAADEAARQLRLRDLAGLIVIDFIDMEAKKHNAMVERRLKEALKNDRARIQVGQISHFGLLEMSRQRLRPSLAETSFVPCPHCGGLGHVRSTESAAIQVLRAIEEEGSKRRSAEIVVHAATSIAMYVLNHKRERLMGIEARYGMHVTFASDETLQPPEIRIERLRAQVADEGPATITPDGTSDAWPSLPPAAIEIEDEDVLDSAEETPDEASDGAEDVTEAHASGTETAEEAERSRRKRRRRRRGGKREDGTAEAGNEDAAQNGTAQDDDAAPEPGGANGEAADIPAGPADEANRAEPATAEAATSEEPLSAEDEEAQRRRRGRRGGRRRRRDEDTPTAVAEPGAEQPDLPPAYTGPTPANPFGGQGYDIFDVLERAEQAALNAQAPIGAPSGAPVGAPVAAPLPERVAEPAVIVVPISPTPPEPEPEPEAVPETAGEPIRTAPSPVAEMPPAPEPEPEPEPVSATVVQPIVIDTAATPAEKKRGWWRR